MEFLYPEGKEKALIFSYDDGRTADRRLVSLLNQYGLKASFHLNSGRLGKEGYVAAEEVKTLYAGHEVSCHGVQHEFLPQLSDTQLVNELWEDRRALERLVDGPVTGLSYAFGNHSERVRGACRSMGIEYARTVNETGGFLPPEDFLQWNPTCHHNRAFALPELVERFLTPATWRKRHLLYIWGHSYEFDEQDTWEQMEQLCAKLADQTDIWYTTSLDYCRYLHAVRNLICSVEETCVFNPSAQTVWLKFGEETIKAVGGSYTRSASK